jgi:hypothetical protein
VVQLVESVVDFRAYFDVEQLVGQSMPAFLQSPDGEDTEVRSYKAAKCLLETYPHDTWGR